MLCNFELWGCGGENDVMILPFRTGVYFACVCLFTGDFGFELLLPEVGEVLVGAPKAHSMDKITPAKPHDIKCMTSCEAGPPLPVDQQLRGLQEPQGMEL